VARHRRGLGHRPLHGTTGALGARVALLGRKIEKLHAVAAEIGKDAKPHACDIREEDAVRQTVANVLADFGRIDFLVNNAGGQFGSPLEKISAKGWDAVVRTNLTGVFVARRRYAVDEGAASGAIEHDRRCGTCRAWGIRGRAFRMLNFTETAALSGRDPRQRRGAGWIA
jgi:citronellol/citronellal dehydrogenase